MEIYSLTDVFFFFFLWRSSVRLNSPSLPHSQRFRSFYTRSGFTTSHHLSHLQEF